MKYDVFISYSRKDYVDEQKNEIPGNVVSKVKKALSDAGITYWFDEEGIYSGNEFTEKIVSNIEESTIFLFLSTKNANASQWTSKEIACADEFGKYIIPVRIDNTPYNKKVLFRIADRSFVDYKANPEKGLVEMVESIKKYLEQERAEEQKRLDAEREREEKERKKAEELRRQKEQEEQRRIEEQKRIVRDIKIAYKELNNEEKKLLAERDNLLLKTENVTDTEERAALKKDIQESSPISQKFQEERLGLLKEIEELKESVRKKEEEIQRIHKAEAKLRTECQAKLKTVEEAKNKAEAENRRIRMFSDSRIDDIDHYKWELEDYESKVRYYKWSLIVSLLALITFIFIFVVPTGRLWKNELYGDSILCETEDSMLYESDEIIKDSAFNALLYRAKQGDAAAQNSLGVKYHNGEGIPKNYKEALKWYRKAAEQGNIYAQGNLGVMYENGQEVKQDYEEAIKWYRKAAEQGNKYAQNNLGRMYRNGQGVPQNDKEALKWYRKAAENGLAQAQCNLGWMYDIKQDYEEAVKWYRKAAEQGHASAQFNLAWMYRNGQGVPQNDEEAVKWYRKAAEQGEQYAQFNLGWMYENGKGVPKNEAEAVKWYRKAAEQGYDLAKKALKRLGE